MTGVAVIAVILIGFAAAKPQSAEDAPPFCRRPAASRPTTPLAKTVVCLDDTGTLIADARNVPLDPRTFGAAGTGLADDTAAMAATLDAARATGRPVGGTGLFRIDGTLDNAGVRFVTANSYSRNSTDPRNWGFVLEHNNATGPLFAPSGCASGFDGVVLYDPRQTGAGSAPLVRPPMFRFTSKCTDFTFRNSVVVNAYDLFDITASGVIGDWRLNGNRIYAVRYVFDISGAMPEVLLASDNIYSAGVFERRAVFGNAGMLIRWTGSNGAWMHLDTAGRSVDGLKSSNEIVFGYRNWLKISSGRLDVSNVSNPSWDGVLQPIDMEGNAGIGLTIVGGHTFGYTKGVPSANAPAFRIGGSGVRNLSIVGHQLLMAAGAAMVITGRGAGLIGWDGGEVYNWGRAVGASDVAGVTIDAPRTDLSFKPGRMLPTVGSSVCVVVTNAHSIDMATTFRTCRRAFDIGPAPDLKGGIDTSLVVDSTDRVDYTVQAGARFVARGSYVR